MKKIILIVGNSHINSFRRCFGSIMSEKGVTTEAVYVMTNLLKSAWGGFKENAYLRYLQYQDNLMPDLDLRDSKNRIDLVLVGMGLLGGGIATPYGGFQPVPKDDIDNARNYTPRLPLLPNMPEGIHPEFTSKLISEEKARSIYKDLYRHKISKVQRLFKHGKYNSMHWISEPDMTESTATIRFGTDLVQSGLYGMHKRLAKDAVDELIEEFDFQDNLIFHPEDRNLPSGFTDNRYRASILPFDIHLLPEYFQESCNTLSERLIPRGFKFNNWLAGINKAWNSK